VGPAGLFSTSSGSGGLEHNQTTLPSSCCSLARRGDGSDPIGPDKLWTSLRFISSDWWSGHRSGSHSVLESAAGWFCLSRQELGLRLYRISMSEPAGSWCQKQWVVRYRNSRRYVSESVNNWCPIPLIAWNLYPYLMVACSRASSQLAIKFDDSQHVQQVAISLRIRGELVLELFGSTGLSQLTDRAWTFGGIVSVSDSSLCQSHVVDYVWNTHQRAICGRVGGQSLFDSLCLASVLVGEWRTSRGAYCVRDSLGVASELVSKRCLSQFAVAG
jgi:hypothetical protein